MSNYDPTDIRAQEKAVEAKATQDRLMRETEDSDIKWLMNSGRGRRIVWRVLEFAGDERIPTVGNANLTAFALGGMNVGKFLKHHILRVCPEQYVLMLKEHWPKEKEQNSGGTGDKSN